MLITPHILRWKDLQAEISYSWIKDNLLFVGKEFKDKPISLTTMINQPNSQQLNAYLSYSPKFGFWKPTFSIGMMKQNLIYEGKDYNKPYISYTWNNLINLSNDFLIGVNMNGNLEGNENVLLYESAFRTDIRLSKTFLNKKLNVTLLATDIFATDLERWSRNTGKTKFIKWNDGDNRGISFMLSYNFNSTRNKYKGQGAANDERGRL